MDDRTLVLCSQCERHVRAAQALRLGRCPLCDAALDTPATPATPRVGKAWRRALTGGLAGAALITGIARCSATPINLPYGLPPQEAGYPDLVQRDSGEPEAGADAGMDVSADTDALPADGAPDGGVADASDASDAGDGTTER